VVVIIDEAHTLNPELLEEIRLLTNLETPSSKLLQVILLGQPEMDNILSQPQFLPLKQRINVRYRLKPLNREEMGEYILRRLRVAGARTTNLFTSGALKKIYQYSQGIPRLINIVCDNALTNGYASEKKIIDAEVIREVISDLEGSSFRSKKKLLLLSAAAGMTLLLLGALYLHGPGEIWETARVFVGKIWHQARTGLKGAWSPLEEILLSRLS
jgi:general secretion pathway protein A